MRAPARTLIQTACRRRAMAVYETGSRAETAALGERLAKVLRSGSLVLFTGGLGAGKTAFCEGIARGLGCTDEVSSPTFAIVNQYKGKGGRRIHHFDFYRIKKLEEVYDMGYEDYFYSGALCFIEWPELVEELLPGNTIKVTIEEVENGEREVTLESFE